MIDFCGVCGHPAKGFGYAPREDWRAAGGQVMWLCDNPRCWERAPDLYYATTQRFDKKGFER